MSNIIRQSKFSADTILNLLSETTDDYLYMWDIQTGAFYISENAYFDFDINQQIEEDVISIWGSIMVPEDLHLWTQDLQLILKGQKDYHDMEYRVYDKNGQIIWVSCRGTVKKDEHDHPLFMIGRISNIGRQNKFDNVTGLMNRNQFENDVRNILEQGSQIKGVMVVLDIDNFKNINERYSYAFGDRTLNLFSTQISDLLPRGCQMYRLDGDEFAFLMEGGTKKIIADIYDSIQIFVTNHFVVEEQSLFISISAGACFIPEDGSTYQQLFRHAENAVEIAKINGKNQLVFFSNEMYRRKLKIMELQESLHTCVNNGCKEFELFYQPQIDTKTQRIVGAEALLRWHSPKHGEVPPLEFIPLLEENHLIIQVGKWVLEEGARQCRLWQRYNPEFTMSINVSYIQLKENALLEYLKNGSDVSARNLILELTESCWVPNLHFLNQEFNDILEMGYGIAIDDFGTGYSSLSHLKELPANFIKIDRSFIKGITKGSYEYIFLEYTVKLAHIIGLKVCVEGVETEEEYSTVMLTSPDYIQGYFFGRPVNARKFEKLYFSVKEEEGSSYGLGE